jgi:hypothetical protein
MSFLNNIKKLFFRKKANNLRVPVSTTNDYFVIEDLFKHTSVNKPRSTNKSSWSDDYGHHSSSHNYSDESSDSSADSSSGD